VQADASPRWRRVRVGLPDTDPWTLLAPLQADGARLMAWSSPDGVQRFVAVGALAESRPSGPRRFEHARKWWTTFEGENTLTTDLNGAPAESAAPVCLAGFAFRVDDARTHAWQAWGDGALCVPEVVIWRDENGTEATFIVDTKTDDWQGAVSVLHDQLQAWLSRAEETSVNPAEGAAAAEIGDAQRQWYSGVESAQAQMAKGQLQKVVLARSTAYTPAQANNLIPSAPRPHSEIARRDRRPS
jgi:isochorismate synthase EntC